MGLRLRQFGREWLFYALRADGQAGGRAKCVNTAAPEGYARQADEDLPAGESARDD